MPLGCVFEVLLVLVYERGARVNGPLDYEVPRRLIMYFFRIGERAN